MRHINLPFASLLLSMACSAASAQSISEKSAKVDGAAFVRAFMGNCGQNIGSIDRVLLAAKALNFAPLPADMIPLMAPQDPKAEFSGFFVTEGDGSPYMLGVSKSIDNGETLETCTLANPYINTASVVNAIGSLIKLGTPDIDESQMGQRFRLWMTDAISKGSIVSLTDAEAMGYGGATLSITSPSVE
jgi:hypothetical protein